MIMTSVPLGTVLAGPLPDPGDGVGLPQATTPAAMTIAPTAAIPRSSPRRFNADDGIDMRQECPFWAPGVVMTPVAGGVGRPRGSPVRLPRVAIVDKRPMR